MAKSRLDRMPSNDLNEMEEIDLLELFRAVLKYIKLIIVLCILFGVGGFFGTKLLIAPTYTASTSIYLTPQISESGSLDYNSQMSSSREEGIRIGEARLKVLCDHLLNDGRIEDLRKAVSDEAYTEKLYKEYGL